MKLFHFFLLAVIVLSQSSCEKNTDPPAVELQLLECRVFGKNGYKSISYCVEGTIRIIGEGTAMNVRIEISQNGKTVFSKLLFSELWRWQGDTEDFYECFDVPQSFDRNTPFTYKLTWLPVEDDF